MLKRTKGFTLIELSMVLVIIGLVIGGILVAQDLIRAAGLRKIIKEEERVETAVNTFRTKYNELPGDMKDATEFWPQAANCGYPYTPNTDPTLICNGNGDGMIGGGATHNANIPEALVLLETYSFWQELNNAGLYPFKASNPGSFHFSGEDSVAGYNVPALEYRSGLGIDVFYMDAFQSDDINTLFFGTPNTRLIGSHVINIGQAYNAYQRMASYALTPNEARWIDTKMDDGNGYTGKVVATTYIAPPAACQDNSGTYQNSDTINTGSGPGFGCALYIRGAF